MWLEIALGVFLIVASVWGYKRFRHWMDHLSISKLREMKRDLEQEFRRVAKVRLETLNQSGTYKTQGRLLVGALEDMKVLTKNSILPFKRGGKIPVVIYLTASQWFILEELVRGSVDIKLTDPRYLKYIYLEELKTKLNRDVYNDIDPLKLIEGLERNDTGFFT